MIREQKQCSSSPAWRASGEYKIYSDNALRSASATRGDAAVLQLAANCGNLSLTEASIWRISA
jgi:hypothetical protein